jgi:hypothetical protein
MTSSTRVGAAVPAALAADVVCIAVFCAIGRRSHAEGITVGGVATTAWPFLVGAAVGWVLARAWRRPLALAPTGVVVWLCTVVVGMLLRRAGLAGPESGTAPSFIVVASLVTAALLLGWRAGAAAVGRTGI